MTSQQPTHWFEITLRVPREQGEAMAELLASVLPEIGQQGVSITHEGIPIDRFDDDDIPPAPTLAVRAYLPNDDQVAAAREAIEFTLAPLGIIPIYAVVSDEDWAEAWKAHYHTTRLGKRLVVRPLWEDGADLIQPGDLVIALDPGMAFGTGTHPTTRLCLEALDDLMQPGLKVLDLGSGSGILAIGAALLGASHVLAVDIDPVAVEATIANAEANGVADKITAQEGGLESVVGSARRFDLLVANILARTIIQMCDPAQHLGEVVRPGGKAIFSGIMVTQAQDVTDALAKTGLIVTNVRQEGDWVALDAYRPHDPT